MTIFLRELKRNRKSFFVWTIILVLYNIMAFSMYPSLANQGDSYTQILANMPKELLAAFNIDQLDFANILSFFGTYSYLYFLLTGSIYAMILGAGILSKEESDKTIEFLLSKPITRSTIITGKITCAALYLFLFNLIFSSSSFILIETYKTTDYSHTALLILSVSPLIVFYLFASIGLLISIFVVKAKSVYPIAIGAAMGAFILGIISEISSKANALKYFSPYKYVDSVHIINNQSIESKYIVIFIIVTVTSIVLTYILYNKKDITI